MFQIFKVSGDSLYPFFKDGQRVICRKVSKGTPININDAVVFEKENYGVMIKRVISIEKNKYFVSGTDPMSIDSRNFGSLDRHDIKFKVLFKF